MGFSFGKVFKELVNIALDTPQKSNKRELMDEYDFRENFASVVESWEDKVNDMNYICDEWTFEQNPAIYKRKFEEYYKEVLEFLKNDVKTFLSDNSEGYNKTYLNEIYKDLLEAAKENKKDFLEDEYPRMQEDYKEYLAELREEEKERKEEEKERATMTKAVIKKLKSAQPVKQKGFLAEFEDQALIKDIINEQINLGIISREKKGGVYVLSLVPQK